MPKGGRRATSWTKGESGNIAGRPKRPEAIEAKKIVADVKAAAREHTQDALDTLKTVMSMQKRRWRPASVLRRRCSIVAGVAQRKRSTPTLV
jgi:hypothetical protein